MRFSIYSSPIADVARNHNARRHQISWRHQELSGLNIAIGNEIVQTIGMARIFDPIFDPARTTFLHINIITPVEMLTIALHLTHWKGYYPYIHTYIHTYIYTYIHNIEVI